ncbi:MAG: hypothetical protein LBG80_19215 [Bacteroidales bacterium]|jgi:hypothetical protein|nr:hypothetical protein [Bacteroidales bacterium]
MDKKVRANIPTKEFIVVFNYKSRMVYIVNSTKDKNYIIGDCLPANFRETEIFIKNFYKKGIKECRFREYIVHDKLFHGTAKYKKTYETLELDKYQYYKCLEVIRSVNGCNSISDAFNYICELACFDEKARDKQITSEMKKYISKAFKEFIKDLSKKIEKDD